MVDAVEAETLDPMEHVVMNSLYLRFEIYAAYWTVLKFAVIIHRQPLECIELVQGCRKTRRSRYGPCPNSYEFRNARPDGCRWLSITHRAKFA